MSSLFKKPEAPAGVTFMLRGEPGSGKTRFALGAKRVTKKTVAYIGTDRGAKFYAKDPEIGGFLHLDSRDPDEITKAIAELAEDNGETYGAVVLDTVTDLWAAEQRKAEKSKKGKDGKDVVYIPINGWRPLREGHEQKLRDLQALPLHVFLICEEKPIYEKVGGNGDSEAAELKEVGSKEDADKKDSYVSDVRLRFFVDRSKTEPVFCAEVLKDRTGTFPMGAIVESPNVEAWVQSAVAAKEKPKAEKPAEKKPRGLEATEAEIEAAVDLGDEGALKETIAYVDAHESAETKKAVKPALLKALKTIRAAKTNGAEKGATV